MGLEVLILDFYSVYDMLFLEVTYVTCDIYQKFLINLETSALNETNSIMSIPCQ